MILVTRLNGHALALNPDLIERAEATPDTIVSLVSGAKHVITESLAELSALITAHRADILRASLGDAPAAPRGEGAPALHVISGQRES